MGRGVEVEGKVAEVEGVVWVGLFVGGDGFGETGVAYVAPWADAVVRRLVLVGCTDCVVLT